MKTGSDGLTRWQRKVYAYRFWRVARLPVRGKPARWRVLLWEAGWWLPFIPDRANRMLMRQISRKPKTRVCLTHERINICRHGPGCQWSTKRADVERIAKVGHE